MEKNRERILLIIFCAGILMGLLIPRWLFPNVRISLELLDEEAFRQYVVAPPSTRMLLPRVAFIRLVPLLILFLGAYTAAGFWIFVGAGLAFGISQGLLAAVCVLQMRYFGILFWICALLPQWLFYGMAGKRAADFMERRRMRTFLCNGNIVPSYNRKIFSEFLKINGMAVAGLLLEVYCNPWIITGFLRVYLER